MNYPNLRAGALAVLTLAAFAQAHAGHGKPLPDPAEAGAPVPPTRYESFVPSTPAPGATASPADNWKASNRTVGSYDSMSLTMGPAESKAPDAAAAPPESPSPMQPMPGPAVSGPAAPPPKADPHAHHHPQEVK